MEQRTDTRRFGKGQRRAGIGLRAGETLVEVMVSIVVFLLVVALLQGAVSFCANAQAKSREIRRNTRAITESLWRKQGTLTKGADTETLIFQGESAAFEVDVTRDRLEVPYKDGEGADRTVTFYQYGPPDGLPSQPGGDGG